MEYILYTSVLILILDAIMFSVPTIPLTQKTTKLCVAKRDTSDL
jgi:hypothetical protein